LQDASDRFEIMCRDPRDPNLVTLETDAVSIVGNDWHTRLDKIFIENLGKFRKYDGRSVQDLLRALRNKVRLSVCGYVRTLRVDSFLIPVEASLSGPARKREAASRAHTRRLLVVLHAAISAPGTACSRCGRWHTSVPGVDVQVVF